MTEAEMVKLLLNAGWKPVYEHGRGLWIDLSQAARPRYTIKQAFDTMVWREPMILTVMLVEMREMAARAAGCVEAKS